METPTSCSADIHNFSVFGVYDSLIDVLMPGKTKSVLLRIWKSCYTVIKGVLWTHHANVVIDGSCFFLRV
jgi:hypothetical protein